MRIPLFACMAIALGLTAAPTAQSATTNQYSVFAGGNCQLSIPTTDTKFRPRATGARNESTTTGSFVICPFASPSSGGVSTLLYFYATLYSIDGNAHNNVSCTGVTGVQSLSLPPVYSTQLVTIPATGAAQILWQGSNFGGIDGTVIAGSTGASVTCNLPPQTGIDILVTNYNQEIGT